ncbi:hypothetical protein LO772_10245 [Yinghuangia sp. ASG 101]|uniref:hypothetical protein n=1 Tax=Yinghuangia sp. ASG 101 TaxID=2896848 RepID=UPI001E30739F|nr:hypothetical protein [Yinghuangia sp. ASG 101]UGQ13936.1 hypothetical protein LO772_10245 [Yinghuangia sp. ASG 101]
MSGTAHSSHRQIPAPPARPVSLLAVLVAALLAFAVTGCVTVDGEHTRVAPLDEHEAAQVLAEFDARNNEVYTHRDTDLNARIETGPVGAIDQASLRIMQFTDPQRTREIPEFTHDRPQFWIPRTIGWPKWFAVQNTPSYPNARAMLLVFTKQDPDAPWQAAWGPTLRPGETFPEPYRDAKGHVVEVPADAADLVVAPQDTAGALTAYLTDGRASAGLFADEPTTTEQRRLREEPVQNGFVRQFIDTPAAHFPPLAIRTKGGGALVLFAVTHSMKLTVQPPNVLGEIEPEQQAFLAEPPKKSVTEHRLTGYAAVVPPAGDGQVRLVATMSGLIGAEGE